MNNNGSGSTKSVQIVKTPADFMAVVNSRWKIDWDLAANAENAQYGNFLSEEGYRIAGTHGYLDHQYSEGQLPGAFGMNWAELSNNYLWLNPPFCSAEPACKPDCTKDKCRKRGSHNLVAQPGIAKWMEKCKLESQMFGAKIITLTLASVGAAWYKDYVEGNANVWVLRGRLKFDGHKDLYPKDLMLCEWARGMNSFGHFDWRKSLVGTPVLKEEKVKGQLALI